ncbi:MAG: aminoglycoside phosphotransferase family protein, partial [Acidobacteriales bacterium]|nr:aminoglycoside phosphotransferase family protein [Terriglobales bacterium]
MIQHVDHQFTLSPEWLTSVLRDSGVLKQAAIRSVNIEPSQSSRSLIGQIFHLHIEYDTHEPGAPSSLIAKLPTDNPDRRAYFTALGMYEREQRFYAEIAQRTPLLTPKCYFAGTTERGLSLLLLEDLSPARSGSRIAGCSFEQAEHAIREIAGLHISWWDSRELARLDWLPTYDPSALQTRFRQVWQAVCQEKATRLPRDFSSIPQRLSKKWNVLGRLGIPPLTLIHRDYQLDNIFFLDDGSLVVIDWQLMMRGHGVFDVASFLCWNLPPEKRAAWEMELLENYHGILVEADIQGYSFAQCYDDYRVSLLECLARVISIIGADVVEDEQLRGLLDILL